MLRYLKCVQTMKKILEENNLQVMCTIARYACAYEAIAKPEWWDKSKRYASPSFYNAMPNGRNQVLDPLLNKEPISATCRVILVVRSICLQWSRTLWSGTSPLET